MYFVCSQQLFMVILEVATHLALLWWMLKSASHYSCSEWLVADYSAHFSTHASCPSLKSRSFKGKVLSLSPPLQGSSYLMLFTPGTLIWTSRLQVQCSSWGRLHVHHPDKQVLASLLSIRFHGRRSWISRRGRTAHQSCCRHPCLFWNSSHHYRNLADKRISAIHYTIQAFTGKKFCPGSLHWMVYGTEFLHE